MYSQDLISKIIPIETETPETLENAYPLRELPKGALVTRFGPSPTGFLHIGGVYTAMISKNLAENSGGTFFIRIEDTDQEREVKGAYEHFDTSFEYFDIAPLETPQDGSYGPYKQSERSLIYLAYIKKLLAEGRAYPCFCSKEELEHKSEQQRSAKVDTGYYGRWATCKNLSPEEVERRIDAGESYVIRFKCNGEPGQLEFYDVIRGNCKTKQNINDVVILKSSKNVKPLPTYHLAHAVDDHLMRVNLVVRGDEWVSSVPLHFQLFDALGFEQINYAHIAPLMKQDNKSKRKLSKRKDPEASVDFYMEKGFPAKAVLAFLKGLANSRLADGDVIEAANGIISLAECQVSGPLVDMVKLRDVSSNYIAQLSANQIFDLLKGWSEKYSPEVHNLIADRPEFTMKVIDSDRFSNGRVRKDLAQWSQFIELFAFFYEEKFDLIVDFNPDDFFNLPVTTVKQFLTDYLTSYEECDTNEEWFENLKMIADKHGFAENKKIAKNEPDKYHSTMKEASGILRMMLTGRPNSPSLYEVTKILGKDKTIPRLNSLS